METERHQPGTEGHQFLRSALRNLKILPNSEEAVPEWLTFCLASGGAQCDPDTHTLLETSTAQPGAGPEAVGSTPGSAGTYPRVPFPDMGGLGGFCVGGLVRGSPPPPPPPVFMF